MMKNNSEAAGQAAGQAAGVVAGVAAGQAVGMEDPGQPVRRRGTLRSLMRPVAVAVLALGITAAVCRGDQRRSHVDAQSPNEAVSTQTMCPVMPEDKIDPNVYTDYKGKRIFFCCPKCKAPFAKNPEKYLWRLPQFASVPADASHEGDEQSPGEAVSTQTMCPVMPEDKIDPNVYTDYEGKRIFFCCPNCKAPFAKDPEKYLSRLSRFVSVQAGVGHEGDEQGNHANGFSLRSLLRPMGILTISMVGLTICLGLLRRTRRLRPGLLLKLHKIAGICVLISGLVHAAIVLLTH